MAREIQSNIKDAERAGAVRQKISDTVGEGTSQITTPKEARKRALNKKIEEM